MNNPFLNTSYSLSYIALTETFLLLLEKKFKSPIIIKREAMFNRKPIKKLEKILP